MGIWSFYLNYFRIVNQKEAIENLLSPIAIYYSLKLFFFPTRKKGTAIFLMTVLPLLFSFSLGVLGGLAVTFVFSI